MRLHVVKCYRYLFCSYYYLFFMRTFFYMYLVFLYDRRKAVTKVQVS